jgi:hypothetical protein
MKLSYAFPIMYGVLAFAAPLWGQSPIAPGEARDTARIRGLDTVKVTGRIDDLVGVAGTA